MLQYVNIPSYVIDKLKAGKMTLTHFSDILRMSLLDEYGGLWLDSTILVTEPLIKHKDLVFGKYFTMKTSHTKDLNFPHNREVIGCNATYLAYGRWADFAHGSNIKHNPLFRFVREFLYQYWLDHDSLIDYFLIGFATEIAYDNIEYVHREMDAVPLNNDSEGLFNNINNEYSAYPFDKILKGVFLHKLDWREDKLNLNAEGTVLREIERRYNS